MRELSFITEVWLPCIGYEGSYEVSSEGRVRSIDRIIYKRGFPYPFKGQILKQTLNKKGYPFVRFHSKNKSLDRNPHRLVALAFVPNPYNKKYVNHINGIKTDCRAINLEWSTNSENQIHAYKLGLQPSKKGENNSNTVLKDSDVTLIKLRYNSGLKISEVSKELNINMSILRQIIYGRTWRSNTTPILKRDERSKTKKSIYHEYN